MFLNWRTKGVRRNIQTTMKVYTKTGDKGKTGLIGGTRVMKNDARLEAYGTIDELNSNLGLLCTYSIPDQDLCFLRNIQHTLFVVGSYLATDTSKVELNKASVLTAENIDQVEKEIDRLDAQLPKLEAFILPGGCAAASVAHICRTVARRAERRMYDVNDTYGLDMHVLVYINRLSDYFFVFSRYLNKIQENEEILWKKYV